MCAYRSTKVYKTSENIIDQSESQKICVYMVCMSFNAESPRIYFGEIL